MMFLLAEPRTRVRSESGWPAPARAAGEMKIGRGERKAGVVAGGDEEAGVVLRGG